MKKLLLLLSLFSIAVKVDAKNIYSDYEFIGYSQEEKQDDELHKYERVLMNRFYKLEMTDFEYLEKDTEGKYDYVDKNDFITETRYSKTPLGGQGLVGITLIKEPERRLLDVVELRNMNRYNYFHPKEIEVFYKGNKLEIEVEGYPELSDGDYANSINIKDSELKIHLPNRNDTHFLEVKIYYNAGADIKFDYALRDTGDTQIPIYNNVTLWGQNTIASIRLALPDEYDEFIEKFSLKDTGIIDFYKYDAKLYKYYNQKRQYYASLEDKNLNGYFYDPAESYYVYKVYERKLLETIPDEPEIPDTPEIPSTPENPEKPIEPPKNPNDKDDTTKPMNPIPDKPKNPSTNQTTPNTSTTTNKNTSSIKKPSNNSIQNTLITDTKKYETSKELTDEEKDTKTNNKTDDKNENTALLSTNKTATNSCDNKINIFELICIILIVIDIIIEILHITCVNNDKE